MSGPMPANTPHADPDSRARTHLANERTFLAWLRTGLSLIALGLATAQFLRGMFPGGMGAATALAAVFIVAGTVMVIFGGKRFVDARRAIEAETYTPLNTPVVASVIFVAIAGVLSLVYVLEFL